MATHLLLHIQADDRVMVYHSSQKDQWEKHAEYTNLNQLDQLPEYKMLSVLIPGDRVFCTSVKMPKLSRNELRKAIPYALEDQLIEPVEQLFFAIGHRDQTGYVAVAVVARDYLQKIINQLQVKQLIANVLIPDFLAYLLQPEQITLLKQDELCSVRLNETLGFSADHANLLTYLNNTSAKINCYGDIPAALQQKNIELTTELIDAKLEAAYSSDSCINQPAINLLQAEFRGKAKSTDQPNEWRWCTYLAIILIVIFFAGKFTDLIYLKHQNSTIQQKITSAYQQVFGKTIPTDAKLQLQVKQRELLRAATDDQFLRLLSTSATILKNYPKITLENLQFSDQKLTLSLRSPKLTELAQLSKQLIGKNLSVTQTQLTTNKTTNTAILVLQEKQ